MDKVKKLELNEFWGGEIHTEDLEVKAMIAKIDSIIAKGQIKWPTSQSLTAYRLDLCQGDGQARTWPECQVH